MGHREPKTKATTTHNSKRLRSSVHIKFQPSIRRLVPRGINALAKVRTLLQQGGEELRGRLLQVSDVAEGQVVGVVVQHDHFFACASEVPTMGKLT